jgi:hypothetical protein
MLKPTCLGLLLLASSTLAYTGQNPSRNFYLGAQSVNLRRLEKLQDATHEDKVQPLLTFQVQGGGNNGRYEIPAAKQEFEEFKERWFEQPLDHFSSSSCGHTWRQRYWVNARHYKPGSRSPVIVLDTGETSGEVSNWSYCIRTASNLFTG